MQNESPTPKKRGWFRWALSWAHWLAWKPSRARAWLWFLIAAYAAFLAFEPEVRQAQRAVQARWAEAQASAAVAWSRACTATGWCEAKPVGDDQGLGDADEALLQRILDAANPAAPAKKPPAKAASK